MKIRLSLQYPAPPPRRSPACSRIANAFGLGDSLDPCVIARDLSLEITPGQKIVISGPSGSGKSSLLRALSQRLAETTERLIWPERLSLPDVPLIEALLLPFPQAVALLTACGLSEPRLMLLPPTALSDGQRWRFRLALAFASEPEWLVLDEFAALLDKTAARVLALNLRRMATTTGVGLLLATSRPESLSDFAPDLLLTSDGDRFSISPQPASRKTPCERFSTNSTSPWAPERTGRISLGGITAPVRWGHRGSSRFCGTTQDRSASACSAPVHYHSRRATATSDVRVAGAD